MKDFLLVLSALITIGSVIPYIRNILAHKTKPNLTSWITWTLLTGIATAAEIGAGEYRAAIFTGAAVMATSLVVFFGFKHGYVKYSRFDVICQLSAIVGIILWQLFDSPALAVIASVTIDFIGALPTVRHSWLNPLEETWQTFAISAFGAVLALLALDTYNVTSMSYAVYIIVINVAITCTILLRLKTRIV